MANILRVVRRLPELLSLSTRITFIDNQREDGLT